MSDCLVIIDVQNGFLTNDTDYVLNRIKNLVEKRKFNHIVATRFINTSDSPHFLFLHWDKMMDHKSQELDPYIAAISEKVFDKSVNSCFTKEFSEYLKAENISKLYFLGIDTDCCVLKSAFDCFDRKIPFEVILDCCASTGGRELHNAAREIMLRNFGTDRVRVE